MEITEALEICITRHECGRGCINCRFYGEGCIKLHRKASREIIEANRLREEIKKHGADV